MTQFDRRIKLANIFAPKAKAARVDDVSGRSSARIVFGDLLSEGPIQGLAKPGLQGVFADGKAIERPNGQRDFEGVRYVMRRGTAFQQPVPKSFGGSAVENSVGVVVSQSGGAVTRAFVNPNADIVVLRLAFQLQEQTSKGGLKGAEVRFKVFIKEGSSAFVERLDRTVKGRYPDLTEIPLEFKLNNANGTVGNFEVRVTRITPDSNNQNLQQVLRWQAYSQITTDRISYKYSAMFWGQIRGDQFDSEPERGYLINGRTIQIPHNATRTSDGALAFSGGFNGTLYTPTFACSDPIWVAYDLLTNKRYGMGRYKRLKPEQINIYDLYAISVRNNDLISFQGRNFRRYFFQATLLSDDSQEAIWENLKAILASCHAAYYWAGGQLRFWQDSPATIKQIFSSADIEEGSFRYGTTDINERATIVYGSYNDPTNFFKLEDSLPVENELKKARYGVNVDKIGILGNTSRDRAMYHAAWKLWGDWNQTETLTFSARPINFATLPGDIIGIQDQRRAQVRYGGLIVSGTTSAITLDSPVTFGGASGINPVLYITLPNGMVESRSVTNAGGTHTVLNVSPAFSQTPNPESNWVLRTNQVELQQFRVLGVDPISDPTKIEVFAIEHNPNKYYEIETGTDLPELPIRLQLPAIVSPPVQCRAAYYFEDRGVQGQVTKLIAIWQPPTLNNYPDPTIGAYLVEWSLDGGIEWQGTTTIATGATTCEFTLPYGNYTARVASVNLRGDRSNWVYSGTPIVSSYHPDTIVFQLALTAAGITTQKDHLDAVDIFVRGCHQYGLRNATNPNASYIQDCAVFVGNTINGVKLWTAPGAPSSLTFWSGTTQTTSVFTWDNATGVGRSPVNGYGGLIKTGINCGAYLNDNVHLAVYRTGESTPPVPWQTENGPIEVHLNPRRRVLIGAQAGYFYNIVDNTYPASSLLALSSIGEPLQDSFAAYTERPIPWEGRGTVRSSLYLSDRKYFLLGQKNENTQTIWANGVRCGIGRGLNYADKARLAPIELYLLAKNIDNSSLHANRTAWTSSNSNNGTNETIGFYSVGFALPDSLQGSYSELVNNLQTALGRATGTVNTFAQAKILSADTVSYRDRLLAIGVTLSDVAIEALERFVYQAYLYSLRNSSNPSLSLVEDFCPFLGSSLNGVKLWNRAGSPQSLTLSGFTNADWSDGYGLNPGTNNSTKSADTGVVASNMTPGNMHLSVYTMGSTAASGADIIGYITGSWIGLSSNINGNSYFDSSYNNGIGRVSVANAALGSGFGCWLGSRATNGNNNLYSIRRESEAVFNAVYPISSYGNRATATGSGGASFAGTDTFKLFYNSIQGALNSNKPMGGYSIGKSLDGVDQGFSYAERWSNILAQLMGAVGRAL